MDAHYSVSVDPARDLVTIIVSGFFSPASITGFLEARNAAHARLRCGPHEHATLADVREAAIQSQEMVARFQQILADPTYRSRRLAVVTASSLARMQALRAAGNRDARFFDDLAEAEAWVLAPGPACQDAA